MNAAIELFEKEERLYRDTLCNTMVKPQHTVGFTHVSFRKGGPMYLQFPIIRNTDDF